MTDVWKVPQRESPQSDTPSKWSKAQDRTAIEPLERRLQIDKGKEVTTMFGRRFGLKAGGVTISLAMALTSILPAYADSVVLKKDTEVKMAFDQSLSSTTAKPGDRVMLHVIDPVIVDGKTVIPEGAKVRGIVKKVDKRKHFGVNANIQLYLDPVKSTSGTEIPLGFHSKHGDLSRPSTAAGASAGSAVLLGPIGLAAGYFVVGKKVTVKPGDKLTATVDDDVTVNAK